MLYMGGKAMEKGEASGHLNVHVVDPLGVGAHCDQKETRSRRLAVICYLGWGHLNVGFMVCYLFLWFISQFLQDLKCTKLTL